MTKTEEIKAPSAKKPAISLAPTAAAGGTTAAASTATKSQEKGKINISLSGAKKEDAKKT